jgi:glycosyltransferase involved in cell wall biosynthesis
MKRPTSEPIRVLFMVAEYDRISGGQQSLLQLLKALPAYGVEPLVCFPAAGRCSDAFERAGIPIVIIPGPPMLTSYGQHLLRRSRLSALKIFFTQMAPYSWRVMREMRRRRIGILHCNSVRSLLFAGFMPRVFGCKVVWHVRGQLLPFNRTVRRVAEKLANRIIVVARALTEEITPRARYKCRRIYNGIDEHSIVATNGAKLALPFGEKNGQKIVATVAAVTPFKGYHHLLSAARLMKERMADQHQPIFLCVGDFFDKKYAAHLQKLVAEYDLKNFYFLGWQENPFPYYRLADVVVLPTVEREELKVGDEVIEVRSGEGLPRTVLEAMYCEKPTIATSVAGVPEQIIDGETGILVPPSNPEALAEAILRLLGAPATTREQMGKSASARARDTFSTARMVRETVDVYRELLGQESRAK